MSDQDRVPYQTIKTWLLEAFYKDCIHRAYRKGFSIGEVFAALWDDFELAFERPIECLMRDVVQLALRGTWVPVTSARLREDTRRTLGSKQGHAMLADLPPDEAEEFTNDLRALGLL